MVPRELLYSLLGEAGFSRLLCLLYTYKSFDNETVSGPQRVVMISDSVEITSLFPKRCKNMEVIITVTGRDHFLKNKNIPIYRKSGKFTGSLIAVCETKLFADLNL